MKLVLKMTLAVSCQLLAVSWLWACPRCFAASPYRTGLIWATLLLLPVPFLLMGWVVVWILRHSKDEFPPV